MVFGERGALRVYSTEPYPELVRRYAPQVEARRKAEKASNKKQRDKKRASRPRRTPPSLSAARRTARKPVTLIMLLLRFFIPATFIVFR